MPEIKVNKKKYSLSKLIGFWSLMFALASGIVTGIVQGVRIHDEYVKNMDTLDSLKINDERRALQDEKVELRLDNFEDFMLDRSKSYAVGFRVITSKGKTLKVWRDWKGVDHPVYRDSIESQMYGIDTYFYIERSTGQKIYKW